MGALTVQQVTDSVLAITRNDAELAQDIVQRDAGLDALDAQIEHDAVRIIALRQPMAQDLRHTLSAMRIAGNLERCGDLGKSIAKRALAISEINRSEALQAGLERIGKLATARLKQVMDAYAARDPEQAMEVWRQDREIDQLYESLFRELLTYMMADPRTITECAHLLFVAKNLERVGDHATNIAELLIFEVSGEAMPGSGRPKWDSLAEIES